MKVNLKEKFNLFSEQWTPKIVGELNGQFVKLAKVEGVFDWHTHEGEDELFLVVKGELTIRLKNENIHLKAGEFYIVPAGTEHQPAAKKEAWVMLFEPKKTTHTGNLKTDRTVNIEEQEWI